MIALFNAQIVIGNHYIVTANHCANYCSRWKFNFINGAAYDARCTFITVGNGFNCFCYTTT
ncbi:Uncharacterised protein [Citrobacter koseri]|nr:Uncharacterised protein [Citrobacter koseri]